MTEVARCWLDPESWIDYCDGFLDQSAADDLLAWAVADIEWEERGDSRLLAWYGAFEYQYPGVSHPAREIPSELTRLCLTVQNLYPDDAGPGFDGIRLNRYDSATSFTDFHADDEPSLVSEYPIAFVSLGWPRTLLFRSKSHTVHPGYAFSLGHGNLLVMGGGVQRRWHHGVPIEPHSGGTRVSVTLRKGSYDQSDDGQNHPHLRR